MATLQRSTALYPARKNPVKALPANRNAGEIRV
jgi:hypothetical protein